MSVRKTLTVIGIVLLVIIGIMIVLGLIAPREYSIERSIVIRASRESVFDHIKYWRNWDAWSPWAERDSSLQVIIEGEDGKIGSMYKWIGDPQRTGKGEMTNSGVMELEAVAYHLHFIEPWQSESDGYIRVIDATEGTRVTWSLYGKNAFPYNIFTLFMNMDKMIGNDFERGLERLKGLCEQAESLSPKAGEQAPDIHESPLHTKDISIEWVFVAGGTFDMGDTFGDGRKNEKPVHKVTVSGFYLSRTEVTVGQFRKFVQATGYRTDAEKRGWAYAWTGSLWEKVIGVNWRNPVFLQRDDHPVIIVSWNDAAAFCQWAGYRLPTEAEWEYAAREGGKKVKWSGTNNVSMLTEFAWYSPNSNKQEHPVGTKRPNALGLYDMSGNVWEWCADWFDEDYYTNSPRNNPKGPSSGEFRSLRGGSWYTHANTMRCALRNGFYPDDSRSHVGFRCAR